MPMARCLKLSLSWLLLARGLDMDFDAPSPAREEQRLQAFDCDAGLSEWRIVWSQEKKRWCCANKNRGCPPPPPPLPGASPMLPSNLRGSEKPLGFGINTAVGMPPLITDPSPRREEYDAYNRGITEGKLGEYVMKYLEEHPGQVKGISKKVLDDVHQMLREQFQGLHHEAGAHRVQSVPFQGEAVEEPRQKVHGLLLVLVGAMAGLTCSAILCMGMACGMYWARQAVPTQDPLLRTDAENATEPTGIQGDLDSFIGEEQSMVALEEAE